MPFVPDYWRVQRPDDLGSSPALSAVVHASDSRTVRLHLASARSCEPVPLEYSIEWLTCAVASRLDAVMVG
jgi:hypothetical protein